jgi:hypothetical protein
MATIVQFKLNLVELFGVRNFNRRSSVFYDSRKKGGEESEGKAEEIACFSNGQTVQPDSCRKIVCCLFQFMPQKLSEYTHLKFLTISILFLLLLCRWYIWWESSKYFVADTASSKPLFIITQ